MENEVISETAELIACLGVGKDNAVSRSKLAERLQLSARKARELVEQARHEGHLIINEQDGRGYYLPASADDVQKQYNQMTNRAMAILSSRAPFRKFLKSVGRTVK